MGDSEEKLSPELSAVEAQLVQLRPRADGLDRERLAFLAGRESVAAQTSHRAGRWAGRWMWPAAFSTMTTVAAVLLVMLLLAENRPAEVRLVEVPVEVRVEVPVERTVYGVLASEGPGAVLRDLATSVSRIWPRDNDEDWPALAASHVRLLDRVLEEGADAVPLPNSPAAPVAVERSPRPVSHRELRDDLLGLPAAETRRPERSLMDTLIFLGASS